MATFNLSAPRMLVQAIEKVAAAALVLALVLDLQDLRLLESQFSTSDRPLVYACVNHVPVAEAFEQVKLFTAVFSNI